FFSIVTSSVWTFSLSLHDALPICGEIGWIAGHVWRVFYCPGPSHMAGGQILVETRQPQWRTGHGRAQFDAGWKIVDLRRAAHGRSEEASCRERGWMAVGTGGVAVG